jgi:hypothetical protein
MAADPRRTKLIRAAIVLGGLLVAANLFVLAGLAGDDAGPTLPSAIEQLFPNAQEVIRPQDTVGADLATGYQGVLYINGAQVPEDQMIGDPGLGAVTFRPGCAGVLDEQVASDCLYREFDPGTYNLKVEYWPIGVSKEEAQSSGDVETHGWQIKVG